MKFGEFMGGTARYMLLYAGGRQRQELGSETRINFATRSLAKPIVGTVTPE